MTRKKTAKTAVKRKQSKRKQSKSRPKPRPKKPTKLASARAAVTGVMAGAVAAVAKRMPGTTPDMDAITLLENDHRRLEDLLKEGEDTTQAAVKRRANLLQTITVELGIHELIEEKFLYPALEKYPETRAIVLEGFEEHHVADLILKELHDVRKNAERWAAKFKVLKENIEHHIEEEEGPMFRTARGVMSLEELRDLGAQMARMKRDAERGRLPKIN